VRSFTQPLALGEPLQRGRDASPSPPTTTTAAALIAAVSILLWVMRFRGVSRC
jgi:hypothetical protein